ncbi:hypothetical protein LSM04_003188 [Trypanosoma melophagium]|uniref:uncharacterized protein n=1 Tax=Trypanosoma melophagium TaxID=715481 RepID=UPI00351AA514|nr:hypothetical protein LSM04_003188 [Trypanosoma melophagium]
MQSSRRNKPQSLKSICDELLRGCTSSSSNSSNNDDDKLQQQRTLLESLFKSHNSVLSGVPTSIALRHTVELFVKEHADRMQLSSDMEALAAKEIDSSTVCDLLLRYKVPLESLKAEWKGVLEETFTKSSNDSRSSECDVLCLDSENDTAWEVLQLGEETLCNSHVNKNTSRDILSTCVREWAVTKQDDMDNNNNNNNNNNSHTEDFSNGVQSCVLKNNGHEILQAVREVLNTDLDTNVLDENYEFWIAVLLTYVEKDTTSLEAVSVVEMLYMHCTAQEKLYLVESIRKRIQHFSDNTVVLRDIFLKLLHQLLLRTPDDIIAFTDEEILELFLQSLRVIVNHITLFNAIDTQAQWLRGLLVRPSLVCHIVSLPNSMPEIIDKLIADTTLTPHVIALIVIMLPLWMGNDGIKSKSVITIFEGIVNAILHDRIAKEMLTDLMICIGRCVHGISLEKRSEYVNIICDAVVCRMNESVVAVFAAECVPRILELLLRFACPSSHFSDEMYRLPLINLKYIEHNLLRRSEKWSKVNNVRKGIIRMFWCVLLRWYGADLPKVVARIVKSLCRRDRQNSKNFNISDNSNSNSNSNTVLWDEKHLVAMSYTTSLWREVEELLESEERGICSLNYVALLYHICSGRDIKIFAEYQLQEEKKEEEMVSFLPLVPPIQEQHEEENREEVQQGQSQLSRMSITWWMLMRWCTNPYARRGLFLATTESLRSLVDNDYNAIVDNVILTMPVEEFDTLIHMPHTISQEKVHKQRKIALLLSIRLWIASLSSLTEPEVPMTYKINLTDMLHHQIRNYWVDYNSSSRNGMLFKYPFGDDSLLVLLCVCSMEKLTEKGCSHFMDKSELQETLEQLVQYRYGFDPVEQVVKYLITGIGSEYLTSILTKRFEAMCDIFISSDLRKNKQGFFLPSPVTEGDLHTLNSLIKLKEETETTTVTDDTKDVSLRNILFLLLELHGGSVFQAASHFRSYPVSKWEGYGRCTELAMGVVQHLITTWPHIERILQSAGVDVYYISLLCVSKWLRDPPVTSVDLAMKSIEMFMRLGQRKWECIVAESLYTHLMGIWKQLREPEELSSSWTESGVFPVSLLWASCLTKLFVLSEGA